jgi:prepilin-type N-terminal cleavage/methylation domain-containing protein
MMRRRDGFTIIELLTVMALIGILAGIAVPHYIGMKRRAVVASVFADVHAVRIAALGYYTETGKFPADSPNGQVPPELIDHLPKGFDFTRTDHLYDWHTWSVGGSRQLVGISVSSGDTELIAQLWRAGGPGFIPIATSSRVTFLLSEN